MRNSIRTLAVMVIGSVVLFTADAAAQTPATKADGVEVTVKYTGKGEVNSNHRLWVWLFDTPEIGPGSMPIAEESVAKNGSVVSFPDVAAKQVWIAVAYDEKGGFMGQAPPPAGSPVAMHMDVSTGNMLAVVPGPQGAVTITFDDQFRMQGPQE